MAVVINGTTGISGVDGSAGTPALQGSDPDTGIFYGTNTVSISTNGSTAVTVDANGDTTIANDLIVNGTTTQTGSTTFTAQTLFPDGTVSAPSISNTGDVNTGVYFPAADNVAIATGGVAALTADSSQNVSVTNTLVMGSSFKRNRIINGNMLIDQRNAGASVTPTATGYNLDRWYVAITQSSKFSVQQNAGSVTPPTGFTNYWGATSSSAYSVISTDLFLISQAIEGLNVYDLAWGTANAKTVTLSFWVRSSLTGTFGGSLTNSGDSRSYPFSYTISSANTWEQKTITVAGDTTGTWLTTNGVGLQVRFSLGTGATYSTTANAWAAGSYYSATGATSVVGTNGATFYITGVQLEVGSVATPYERQIYSDQLAQCQRYYQYWGGSANYERVASGFWVTTTTSEVEVPRISVTMRATPTITYSSVSDWNASNYNTNYVCTAIQIGNSSPSSCSFALTSATGAAAGSVAVMVANNTTNARLGLNAEL